MQNCVVHMNSTELSAGEGLAEGPTGIGNVVGDDAMAIAGGDPEGERLAVEVGVALPVLAPVSRHGLPPRPRPSDRHPMHVPGSTYVGD